MNNIRPAGAPTCWGRLHQDGEEECRQCRFRYDCRTETMEQINKPGIKLPMFGQYAPSITPPPVKPVLPVLSLPSSIVVPLPPRPAFSPPTYQPPPVKTTPTTPSVPVAPTYHQAATGFSLPNPTAPNPLSSWYRPGAPGPAYHFTQYPHESVGSRLAKNAVLRALEAIFGELMQFFRHWTWPPKS